MRRAITAVLSMGFVAQSWAAAPTLEELAKLPQHDIVSISPGGDYVAATFRKPENNKNRMMMVIIDRRTAKPVRVLDPEEEAEISRISWASNERLFVMNAWRGNTFEEYFIDPRIVALNVDGSRRRVLNVALVDMIADDDEHILIERCSKAYSRGCMSFIEKVDNDGGRDGKRIVDSPDINVTFFADNAGKVLFAYKWGDDDVQKIWRLQGDQWQVFNDEAVSGVEITPVGVSRDGASVFFVSEQKSGPNVVERMHLATGERKVVMSDPKLDPAYIVWSADGRQPIGAAYGPGMPRARFWDANDPDAKLMKALEAAFPSDAVEFHSGSRDGQHVVLLVWSDRDPGSYYLLDRASKRTTLIGRRKPWLDPDALASAQSVSFKSRDGVELNGFLTLPTDAKQKPAPLVVLPHGGPYGVYDSWAYDEEVQVLATHGYAVLRVNFRGSGGRGRSFGYSGYRQWGLKIQDDITDGVKWAIAQGSVDPERICILGSSFGGYSALMGVIREPALYKCAISMAGPTDLNITRKWGDTHRSRYGRHYLNEAVGDDPAELFEQSPVKHADKIRVPVFLVHGQHDSRVSFEHAKAMRAAMEKAGKPLETFFFSDETHGIYGEENRVEYYKRVLAFLDKHIGAVAPAGAN